jgi:nitroreductase
VELGLGTCWIGGLDLSAVKQILDIPDFCLLASLLSVGYPAEDCQAAEKERLPLKELIYGEQYGKSPSGIL